MPTGIKVITSLNILFSSVFIAKLLYLHKAGQGAPLQVFANLVGAGALILITLIALLRISRLVGFARVLAYALILVLGLQAMLTLRDLMTGYGAMIIFTNVIIVFYAIGMRGYLASPQSARYFTAMGD